MVPFQKGRVRIHDSIGFPKSEKNITPLTPNVLRNPTKNLRLVATPTPWLGQCERRLGRVQAWFPISEKHQAWIQYWLEDWCPAST